MQATSRGTTRYPTGLDLLGHPHRTDLSRDGCPDTTRQDDAAKHRAKFTPHADGYDRTDGEVCAILCELARDLYRKHHTGKEQRQCHDGKGQHAQCQALLHRLPPAECADFFHRRRKEQDHRSQLMKDADGIATKRFYE